jgi:hypothetical protein
MLNIRYTNPLHTYVGYELANGEFHNPPAEKFAEDNPGITPAPYAPPAITWADIRSKRDNLLAATDWWAVSDRAMSASETAYRQALRDVPQNFASPADVVWPTKPA